MASSLVQFRTDDASKAQAIRICEELGIDLPTYMRGSVKIIAQICLQSL